MRPFRRKPPPPPLLVGTVKQELTATSDEEKAFADLINRSYRKAKAQARWYVQGDAVKDILQEAAAVMWQRWPHLPPDNRTEKFFIGIVQNCAKNHVRSESREASLLVSRDDTANAEYLYPMHEARSPLVVCEHNSSVEYAYSFVHELPPGLREVWLFTYQQDWTPEEIAEHRESSPTTVRLQVARANELIRDAIAKAEKRLDRAMLRRLSPNRTEVTHD